MVLIHIIFLLRSPSPNRISSPKHRKTPFGKNKSSLTSLHEDTNSDISFQDSSGKFYYIVVIIYWLFIDCFSQNKLSMAVFIAHICYFVFLFRNANQLSKVLTGFIVSKYRVEISTLIITCMHIAELM